MIRFILLQNRAGKTRLAKYYIPLDDSEKHSLEYEVHRLIATRDPKFTNFVEVSSLDAAEACTSCQSLCTYTLIDLLTSLIVLAVQDKQSDIPAICWPVLFHVRRCH